MHHLRTAALLFMLLSSAQQANPAGEANLPPQHNSQALAFAPDGEALLVALHIAERGDPPQWTLQTWRRLDGRWQLLDRGGIQPPPRAGFRMVFDAARKQFVLFGGRLNDGTSLADTWLFKEDGAWRQLENADDEHDAAPPPRYIHGMAYDAGRKVTVLFGGRGPDACRYNDTWEFDGRSWRLALQGQSWGELLRQPPDQRSAPTDKPSMRYGPAMTYDAQNQRVLLFGGYTPGGHENDLWQYTADGWRRLHGRIAPDDTFVAPRGSYGASMAADPTTGCVLLTGGLLDAGRTWLLRDDAWTQVGESGGPPGARVYPALAYDPLGQSLVLTGGRLLGRQDDAALRHWWAWAEGKWRALDDRPAPADHPADPPERPSEH